MVLDDSGNFSYPAKIFLSSQDNEDLCILFSCTRLLWYGIVNCLMVSRRTDICKCLMLREKQGKVGVAEVDYVLRNPRSIIQVWDGRVDLP